MTKKELSIYKRLLQESQQQSKYPGQDIKKIIAIAHSPHDLGVEYLKIRKEQPEQYSFIPSKSKVLSKILSFLNKQKLKVIYKKISPQEIEFISESVPIYSMDNIDTLEKSLKNMIPGTYKDFIINDTLFRVIAK